jgi:hypothetical protein
MDFARGQPQGRPWFELALLESSLDGTWTRIFHTVALFDSLSILSRFCNCENRKTIGKPGLLRLLNDSSRSYNSHLRFGDREIIDESLRRSRQSV